MATYLIVDKSTKVLKPGEVRANGDIQVQDGDVFVLDPGVDSSFKFVATPGETPSFSVNVTQSNTNNFKMEFEANLKPVLSIADNVKLEKVNIDAEDAASMDVIAGDNVTIEDYTGSKTGDDTFTAGNNFQAIHTIKTGGGNDSVKVGTGAQLEKIEMGDGSNALTIGDGAVVADISTGDGANAITIGKNATLKDIKAGDGDTTVKIGDNANLNHIHLHGGDNSLSIGHNAVLKDIKTDDGNNTISVGNNVELHDIDTGNGADHITVGDNAIIHDIKSKNGDDTIIVGNNATIKKIDTDGGNDSVKLGTGSDIHKLDGGKDYDTLVSDGDYPQAQNFENIKCFVAGTLIRTNRGDVAVQDLTPGDLIATLDHGLQPLRWIGAATVPGTGTFAPIEFAKGALGNRRVLRVSPQHRMMLSGWALELHFGADEVLVPAKHLVNGTTVRQIEVAEVTYLHLMFDTHQIVWGEGILSESFHPKDIGSLVSAQQQELYALFPALARDPATYGETARVCLRKYESRLLAA